MSFFKRTLLSSLQAQLSRGKSVLLLGPRQTGKTTLVSHLRVDFEISFLLQRTRLLYEKDPDHLVHEIEALGKKKPLIFIDEVQKVPDLMDVIQYLIDGKKAQFILTGSSARKLRHQKALNLLPGRIVEMRLDPLCLAEINEPNLNELLLTGSLPSIFSELDRDNKEIDLDSYVSTFLEEEVRKEAVVRSVPAFARFLELAAIDSGRISNFLEISKQIGVAHTTISSHYQILEDCLIVERFDPIVKSMRRKKLTRSSRYLFFDMGVRRITANEGRKLIPERMGELFEHFIGLELRRLSRLFAPPRTEVAFWRDPGGPEVDWVIQFPDRWIPIEVKWTEHPTATQAVHLETFLDEYPEAKKGYIICRTSRSHRLSDRVDAIPWKNLMGFFE